MSAGNAGAISAGARHRSGREGTPNRSRDRKGALGLWATPATLPYGRGADWGFLLLHSPESHLQAIDSICSHSSDFLALWTRRPPGLGFYGAHPQGGAGFSLPTRFPASRAGRKAACGQDCPPHTNRTTLAGALFFFVFGSGCHGRGIGHGGQLVAG